MRCALKPGQWTMRICDFMVDHLGEWDLNLGQNSCWQSFLTPGARQVRELSRSLRPDVPFCSYIRRFKENVSPHPS